MYNFIADVFHTIAEASSIIFDLRRQFFADAKMFELERLKSEFPNMLKLQFLIFPTSFNIM